jgi:hypothetical protein
MWHPNGMTNRLDNSFGPALTSRTRGCEHCCDCGCHRVGRVTFQPPMPPMPMQPSTFLPSFQQAMDTMARPDNVVDFTRYASPLDIEVEPGDDTTD